MTIDDELRDALRDVRMHAAAAMLIPQDSAGSKLMETIMVKLSESVARAQSLAAIRRAARRNN